MYAYCIYRVSQYDLTNAITIVLFIILKMYTIVLHQKIENYSYFFLLLEFKIEIVK